MGSVEGGEPRDVRCVRGRRRNFVDTANLYTGGTSEKFVGEFLKGRRSGSVLATKYTLNMSPDDPNGGGNHRKNLVQSLDASLKRLGTDYIDLYWVHAWDGMTPSRRRCGPWTTWCGPGRFSTSGSPTPPPGSFRGRTRSPN